MKDEYIALPLVNNTEAHRFEMEVDGYKAIIVYRQTPERITLLHTEVPPELEGKGVATAIIEKTLAYIETNHLSLVPLCPLVVAYIKRHPEWKRIVDPSVTNL
ncbi:GNAT family N-acetyltransferase [Chitinophaga niabensis]|uniref:N-acetyltransferase domain-containing protein n=1 Tax=Chitinophaga niabensis TaxID=536979 RepID=A0A1N6DFT8_9BACT|nr:GNAT family N-acetyltransferase [Chitinophaga niabensis]SIN69567.1 hypothetical protein SAMN04488055_0698 [Chitinophaga niabensis]